MRILSVHASKTYPIYIGDLLDEFGALVSYLKGDKVAVITDTNVAPLYLQAVQKLLAGKQVLPLVVAAGEQSKSLGQYGLLLNTLAQKGFGRKDGIVALGGGVVGDLAAFVASTYMRGIRLVAVPTSLLAMVDSSIGGKTAINLDSGKNLCGTFYQPDAVFVATKCLQTLPPREQQSGWGEIIKYSFLSDTITMSDLQGDVTPQLIAKCLQIKAEIVQADEHENGERKLLNLGHTFGHIIERNSNFALSHGECVVKGMAVILGLSQRVLSLGDNTVAEAKQRLLSRGHDLSFDADTLLGGLNLDKKSDAQGVDLVLINNSLRGVIVPLTYEQIARYLV